MQTYTFKMRDGTSVLWTSSATLQSVSLGSSEQEGWEIPISIALPTTTASLPARVSSPTLLMRRFMENATAENVKWLSLIAVPCSYVGACLFGAVVGSHLDSQITPTVAISGSVLWLAGSLWQRELWVYALDILEAARGKQGWAGSTSSEETKLPTERHTE